MRSENWDITALNDVHVQFIDGTDMAGRTGEIVRSYRSANRRVAYDVLMDDDQSVLEGYPGHTMRVIPPAEWRV